MISLVLGIGMLFSNSVEDRYYVIVFSHQKNVGNRLPPPHSSHTWATFVKVNGDSIEEEKTISWGPEDNIIAVGREAVVGKNSNLKESLEFARSNGYVISHWGPYEISAEFYARGVERQRELESGKYLYKVLDAKTRHRNAINCIHAVSDIAGFLQTGTFRGESASRAVARHFQNRSGWVLDSNDDRHQWIIERLGVIKYRSTKKEL